MHHLITTAACCALIGVANAYPKVVGFNFKKRAHEGSLKARSDALTSVLEGRAPVEAKIGNIQSLYYINATIGTPPRTFLLQLDTGSSDIWVPYTDADVCTGREAAKICAETGAYDPNASSSYGGTAPGFNISYVDGSEIAGDYVRDNFGVGGVTLKNMTMGIAQTADRPLGIMGIGYTQGESIIETCPDCAYPNVIDQLQKQGFTKTRAYSLWLNDLDSDEGSILFGGVDTEKYHGSLTALPVLKDPRSDDFSSFGVALSSVSFKNAVDKVDYSQTNIQAPVILDSGTTLTYIPTNIAMDIIGGVGAFQSSGLWLIPCSIGQTGARIEFGFGGAGGPVIAVGIDEFVLPLETDSGRTPKLKDGTVVCQWGLQPVLDGAPYLFGDTFLRSAYVVHDLDNNMIAIAQTNFNSTKSNVKEITVGKNIPDVTQTATATASAASYSGVPLNTAATSITSSIARGSRPTPTFDLSNPNQKKSAASALGQRPKLANVLLGASFVTSLMFGGALLVLA